MSTDERRNQILQLLQKNKYVTTRELSEQLKATPATIRRDFDYLQSVGALVRSWGKATVVSNTPVPPIKKREADFSDEKRRIAKAAAQFVTEGDSIILDSGSTILAMAEELRTLSTLSVATNFLPLAQLFVNSSVSLQYSGGYFDGQNMSLVGPDCEQFFSAISVSKAFLGTTSLRAPQGFATCSPFLCGVKRRMIAVAQKVYVLMDASKVNAFGINTFATFRDIDYLITTKQLEHSLESRLIDAGVEICYTD